MTVDIDFHRGLSLRDAVPEWPASRAPWWLVAALDSCHQPATLPIARSWIADGARSVPGGGVLIAASVLASALENESVFAGFDEIWAFASVEDTLVTCPVSIASDRAFVPESDALGQWLAVYRPLVGLGDGVGLNVVSPVLNR